MRDIGLPHERTWRARGTYITFDIPRIVETNCEELEPIESQAHAENHFTTMFLSNLHVRPKGRTLGKIREHLSSIYRIFIRDGVIQLRFNGELLTFEPSAFLVAPDHMTSDAQPVTWRRDIELDMGARSSGEGLGRNSCTR